MIVVHHLADSRSQRVLWLLEELGLDYEVRRYERDPVTRLAPPELKAVHPLGKSPILQDAGGVQAETGAIVEHLLTTTPGGARLRPAQDTEAGRRFTYWLHYAEGSAMTPLLLKLIFTTLPRRAPWPVRGIIGAAMQKAQAVLVDPQLASHAAWWETALDPTGWFAGEAFSAADIMMSFPVEAAAQRVFDRADRPVLDSFLARIHARPAYRKALERGGPYAYV